MNETAGFTIVRTFAAPRETVFEAWTTPAHFSAWFGGTASEVPIESVTMDVRPGGTWAARMFAGPDRYEMSWRGEYLEVDPPERLVLTMTDQPDDPARDAIVVLLTAVDGGTEMSVTQSGGHLSAEQYEQAKAGWNTFFDVMAELVEG
jgi:uncharacterized protein YndB with AHSA1/START domain